MHAALVLYALSFAIPATTQEATSTHANWPMIGGTPGNTHYSSLRQINRSNVAKLKLAWSYETGEPGGLDLVRREQPGQHDIKSLAHHIASNVPTTFTPCALLGWRLATTLVLSISPFF